MNREITRTDWRALPVGYLSPSQAWAYIQCPSCYEAERILRIPKPMSADLMIGRFAHASLAEMRRWLVEDPSGALQSTDAALQAGSDAFDAVITEQVDHDEDGDVLPVEIELTKKYADLGQAKDMAANLTRYALPLITAYDREAGVVAAEARVKHLGKAFKGYPELYDKLSDEERLDADEEAEEQFVEGVEPCFPFPIKAYLDVLYANGVLKDAKTSSRNGSPDRLAALQLLMYGMPWWAADDPRKLGWDVMVKTKNPNFAVYWVNGTGDVTNDQYEYARWRVLKAADGICAGDFPPNDGSLFCKFEHGLPTGERAATFPGMEIAV